MLLLLPPALCVLLYTGRVVDARPDHPLLAPRYLNTSSQATTSSFNSETLFPTPGTLIETVPSSSSPVDQDTLSIPLPTNSISYTTFTSLQPTTSTSRDNEATTSTDTYNVTSIRPSYTTTSTFGNQTSTVYSQVSQTGASCVTRNPGEATTVFIILPNPTTVTVTLGGNHTSSYYSPLPEFTPPIYCPEQPPLASSAFSTFPSIIVSGAPPSVPTFLFPIIVTGTTAKSDSQPEPETTLDVPMMTVEPAPEPEKPTRRPRPKLSGGVTTVITTSKNPVTSFTTEAPVQYPDAADRGPKETVNPNDLAGGSSGGGSGGGGGGRGGGGSGGGGDGRGGPAGAANDQGRPSPANDAPVSGVGTGDQGRPNYNPAVVTTVRGTAIEVRPSYAVIGGKTIQYDGPTETNGNSNPAVALSKGPEPTNVVIIDGGIFSAIGSSLAVFDGRTIRYNAGTPIVTVYHKETITLGASIAFDGTTLGGPGNTGTQLGIAGGISVSQIGQSVAVISSSSFTVGPKAVITTVIIDSYTIVAKSSGLTVDGTTLPFPFIAATQYFTVGTVVITQIGYSLLVIDGSTYTIPKAGTSTSINNQQTISQGSDIETSTTLSTSEAVPQITEDTSKPAETSKKSDANMLKPLYILSTVLMVFFFWI